MLKSSVKPTHLTVMSTLSVLVCNALFVTSSSNRRTAPMTGTVGAVNVGFAAVLSDRVTVGVPFTYRLTLPVLFDPATNTVINAGGSPNSLQNPVITDDLNATGADMHLQLSRGIRTVGGTPSVPVADAPCPGTVV